MTRLIVHIGSHATDWDVVRQQLVSSREPLRHLGIHLVPGSDARSWAAAGRGLTTGKPPRELREAAAAAASDKAVALLVSSEQLEDSLREPGAVGSLTTFAAEVAMPVTVVIVLRDQVGYLNELYCERVTSLHMARDFATFVSAPQPAERFDYAHAFEPVTAAAGIEVAAVYYADVVDGAQAGAVLQAARLPQSALEALETTVTRRQLPGPVLIAATRLLFKRMWRLGMFKSLPRGRLLATARGLRDHALERGWDPQPFWGWSEAARDEAIRRYRPGNDVLAAAVHGGHWSGGWATGSHLDVDLAACAPALVVDVLNTVNALMSDLHKAKGAVPASDTQD